MPIELWSTRAVSKYLVTFTLAHNSLDGRDIVPMNISQTSSSVHGRDMCYVLPTESCLLVIYFLLSQEKPGFMTLVGNEPETYWVL